MSIPTHHRAPVGLTTIILAAGNSKRMASPIPKVLHTILGRHIINYVVDLAHAAGSDEVVVVVGRHAAAIRRACGKRLIYAVQTVPRGTGDAALRGLERAHYREVLILNGDVPLLRPETLRAMINQHRVTRAALSIMTSRVVDPTGYGRVIRSHGSRVRRIVEDRDASTRERHCREINVGVYLATADVFASTLRALKPENRQAEYYLTDIVHFLIKQRGHVAAYRVDNEYETSGVNTMAQLARLSAYAKAEWFAELGRRGIRIEDPTTTVIDRSVTLGTGCCVRPFTLLEGRTAIPPNTIIGPFIWIRNGKRMSLRHE